MELQGVVAKTGNCNILHEALHPDHGLAWTDGKSIYLGSVQIQCGEVENIPSQKLGQFDHVVKSIHWSDNIGTSYCYLSVVHPQHVAIWRVEGTVPRLGFKQVRKLNVQPITKGCLWSPGRDILCILSKQQCSFFFSHTENKGSYAFPPVEGGSLYCGCWSKDGNKLVLCSGSTLLVYIWPDIGTSISDLRQVVWKIPALTGNIRSIVSVSTDHVICSAELPLENLCRPQPDAFIIPANGQVNGNDILTPQQNGSVTDTLLNLQKNPESDDVATNQMILIRLRSKKNPLKLCCVGVPGMITPDLLLYEENLGNVIVGSCSQNILQLYVLDNEYSLVKISEIALDKNERPYGMSCLKGDNLSQHQGILIAVGRKPESTGLFVTSPNANPSDVKLKFCGLCIDNQSKYKASTFKNISRQQQSTSSEEDSPRDPHYFQPVSNNHSHHCSEGGTVLNEQKASVSNTKQDSQSKGGKKGKLESHPSMDMLIKRQKTLSELRDVSDSDLSPRDSTVSSPREATVSSPRDTNVRSSSEIIHESKKFTNSDDLKISLGINQDTDNDSNKMKIVEMNSSSPTKTNLEIEKTDFSSQQPKFVQPEINGHFQEYVDVSKIKKTEKPARKNATRSLSRDREEQRKKAPVIPSDNVTSSLLTNMSADRQMEELENQLLAQQQHIENLQKKIDSLSRTVEETALVFPTRYQSPQKPETINVVCRVAGIKECKRTFLLDNGRLHLDTLKQAFNLEYVEIYFDGDPCVVTANIDGYIPMKFEAFSKLIIGGQLRDLYRDTSSEDLGIDGVDVDHP